MISGLYNATSGSILINGYDIYKEPIKAKSHRIHSDQPFIYEKLTDVSFSSVVDCIHRKKEIKEDN
jgi:ABC-type multidrug transport system ATPase subunit